MTAAVLTTALFITQLFLVVIVSVGIAILRSGERAFSSYSNELGLATSHLSYFALLFLLITFGILAFSQEFVVLSGPAFGDVVFPSIGREKSFLIIFMLDVIGAAFLIALTGGSQLSPFSALLFSLPALAIFLRESPMRFFIYTVMAAIAFYILCGDQFYRECVEMNRKKTQAFKAVSLGCLALSTLIGYITRPI